MFSGWKAEKKDGNQVGDQTNETYKTNIKTELSKKNYKLY
jgi:hypothetical protein